MRTERARKEKPFLYKILWGLLLGVLMTSHLQAKENEDPLPFATGERLVYHLKWNGIVAAEVTLEVMPPEEINGKETFHFSMEGKTTSLVAAIVKYEIKIDSYTDKDFTRSLFYKSLDFDRKNTETVKIDFDWDQNKLKYSEVKKRAKKKDGKQKEVKSRKKTLAIPPGTFDVFAAMYNLRRNLMAMENEDKIPVSVTNGRKHLNGNVYVVEDEIIEMDGKEIPTKMMQLDIKTLGNVFELKDKKYMLTLWVSDDKYKIPLKVRGKVKFGVVTAELISIERKPPLPSVSNDVADSSMQAAISDMETKNVD